MVGILVSATLIAAAVVSAAVAWAAVTLAGELRASRVAAASGRSLQLLQLFAPGLAAASSDPRALLAWQPLAATTRVLFAAEFAALDSASGGTFPFSDEFVQATHARWTTDWLAWERQHDLEFKLKTAVAEHDVAASGGGPAERARLESIEREKIELYQRRYADYVHTSKALQALVNPARRST